MSLIRNIFLIILLASLTSCGFGLRKPLALNYKSFDIIGGDQLDQSIAKELSYSEIKRDKQYPELTIEILKNNFTKRILSLAGNGQVGEFELIQTVIYRFKAKEWSKDRRIEAIREYTYDPALYNATAAEEKLLKDSMNEQILRSILTEISNFSE